MVTRTPESILGSVFYPHASIVDQFQADLLAAPKIGRKML